MDVLCFSQQQVCLPSDLLAPLFLQISFQGCLSPSTCESEPSWTVIPGASVTDADVSCKKKIQVSLNSGLVNGHTHFRFCLTNSVGSWCETLQVFQTQLLHASAGRKMGVICEREKENNGYGDWKSCFFLAVVSPEDNFNLLKVGSLLLLVALVIVSMTLFYFVKKKVTVTDHTRVFVLADRK